MVVEVKALKKLMDAIEKAKALEASVHVHSSTGIPRLSVGFEQLDGTEIHIEIAEVDSGGFDFVTKKERF